MLVVKRLDVDGQFAVLSRLETDERGEQAAFSDVLRSVLTGQTGQRQIRENARRAQLHDGLLVWTPVNSTHYYYAPVTGTMQPVYWQYVDLVVVLWRPALSSSSSASVTALR